MSLPVASGNRVTGSSLSACYSVTSLKVVDKK